MSTSNLSVNIRFCVETEIQGKPCKRVPNRFFRIRDLAYFKAGIRDFKGKGGGGGEIRDCNDYGRDTEFGNFNKRQSGNVALKKLRFGNSRD